MQKCELKVASTESEHTQKMPTRKIKIYFLLCLFLGLAFANCEDDDDDYANVFSQVGLSLEAFLWPFADPIAEILVKATIDRTLDLSIRCQGDLIELAVGLTERKKTALRSKPIRYYSNLSINKSNDCQL